VSMPRVELAGHRPEALRAAGPDVLRREVLRMPVGVPGDGRSKRRAPLAGPAQGCGAAGVPEPHRARRRHRQRLLRAPGDSLPLLLRHQRNNPDGEVARLGQVDCGEPDAAFPSVSRKAALRDRRSSLAVTSVAPRAFARCSARPSSQIPKNHARNRSAINLCEEVP
jgi:hypothetical protein